jgi:hypothetical protein
MHFKVLSSKRDIFFSILIQISLNAQNNITKYKYN